MQVVQQDFSSRKFILLHLETRHTNDYKEVVQNCYEQQFFMNYLFNTPTWMLTPNQYRIEEYDNRYQSNRDDGRSYDSKSYDNKNYDNKSYDNRNYDNRNNKNNYENRNRNHYESNSSSRLSSQDSYHNRSEASYDRSYRKRNKFVN